jgi:hypothetical protein
MRHSAEIRIGWRRGLLLPATNMASHDDYADLDRDLPALVDFLTDVVKNAHETSAT